MTKEEAIKICNKIIKQNNEIVKQTKKNKDINAMQLTANCDNESLAIETVLNLLKEKDAETEKKDKIIDLMAEQISNYDIDEGICKQAQVGESGDCEEFSDNCKECIKQYFERKIKE